jgi:hypothetical protein
VALPSRDDRVWTLLELSDGTRLRVQFPQVVKKRAANAMFNESVPLTVA